MRSIMCFDPVLNTFVVRKHISKSHRLIAMKTPSYCQPSEIQIVVK